MSEIYKFKDKKMESDNVCVQFNLINKTIEFKCLINMCGNELIAFSFTYMQYVCYTIHPATTDPS